MRELSPAEFRAALAILANPGTTERERIRSSGLASSTYNVARRRIYAEGWLYDTIVPDPGPCGFAAIEFLLARPTLAQRSVQSERWSSDPECVLLWAGVHVLFGIFFRQTEAGPRPVQDPLAGDERAAQLLVVRGSGSVPVFYDYSGLWARFGGAEPPAGYPRGLRTSSETAARRSLLLAQGRIRTDRQRTASHALSAESVHEHHDPRAEDLAAVIQPRSMLSLARVPPFGRRRIAEVIFVRGSLRASARPSQLLNELTADCQVYPFLFAEASGKVLFAGLGQTDSERPGRVPVPSAARPVMSVLSRYLDPADVLIEPVEAIEERVAHRYPERFPGLPQN
ncbi:MAG: hypothetical protein L3K19_01905 [Thermoplasmata archaeon]|nr:hypothetical protein [Thermoplasmata archaeon]